MRYFCYYSKTMMLDSMLNCDVKLACRLRAMGHTAFFISLSTTVGVNQKVQYYLYDTVYLAVDRILQLPTKQYGCQYLTQVRGSV